MSRLFKGFAMCGAWSCFDEFNRIQSEVLSVIGTYIKILYGALREKLNQIFFEGSLLFLK
jgi:dynein heavy chain